MSLKTRVATMVVTPQAEDFVRKAARAKVETTVRGTSKASVPIRDTLVQNVATIDGAARNYGKPLLAPAPWVAGGTAIGATCGLGAGLVLCLGGFAVSGSLFPILGLAALVAMPIAGGWLGAGVMKAKAAEGGREWQRGWLKECAETYRNK